MSQPNYQFNSQEDVERWIQQCMDNGMSTQLIYALVQKKTEELVQKKSLLLLKRREALVSGNTTVATELHLLMKECENELKWFEEAGGSYVQVPKAVERIIDPETKSDLVEKLVDRLN